MPDRFEERLVRGGMTKVTVRWSDDRVGVIKQKRMHNFQTGYHPTGPEQTLLDMPRREARFVYEALREVFEDDA